MASSFVVFLFFFLHVTKKKCPSSSLCVVCNQELENLGHIFLTCPRSMDCSRERNLWNPFSATMSRAESFKGLCFFLLASFDTPSRDKFVMTSIGEVEMGS